MNTDTKESIKELINNPACTTASLQKIISSLRGPDDIKGCSVRVVSLLKDYTTNRIRSIVSPNYYGTVRYEPLTVEEQKLRTILLNFAPSHFQSHYYEACEAIKIVFGYDLIEERKINVPTKRRGKNSCKANNGDGSGESG
jgi:hypothetical protein